MRFVTESIGQSWSNLSNEKEELISDNSTQEGLVPYESNSKSDYENYPNESKKKIETSSGSKINLVNLKENIKLRENEKNDY